MNTSLPKELTTLINAKANHLKTEAHQELTMQIFDQFLIPYVYSTRGKQSNQDPTFVTMGKLAIRTGDAKMFASTFMLTSIKRVCKRLKKEVSHGSIGPVYSTSDQYCYRANKKNTFK
uniref:Uncharacterized protein n=1 Tax=Clandestinovirus TaxID=2831644 RepID=A0A8F8KTR3_9VIRU|nr:hypothetical protein KOM_12_229 [Clandestinovirus]